MTLRSISNRSRSVALRPGEDSLRRGGSVPPRCRHGVDEIGRLGALTSKLGGWQRLLGLNGRLSTIQHMPDYC
jgi:hypothetical protein